MFENKGRKKLTGAGIMNWRCVEAGDEWNIDLTDLEEEVEHLTKFINEAMWNETTGFYHDLRISQLTGKTKDKRAGLSEVKSIGSYWTLLAGLVPPERLDRFV